MNEATAGVELYGVLAGLTFSASAILFSFTERSLLIDILLTLTIIATMCFMVAAVCAAGAIYTARKENPEDAIRELDLAIYPYHVGFWLIRGILILMGFILGLPFGITILAAMILLAVYVRRGLS